MNPIQAQMIRDSFARVAPKATIAALIFYQRLFAIDPSLRVLFRHDIQEQGEKLMQALRFAMVSLDSPRELQPALESLGRRHVHYGVEERHYESVGAALIQTLEHLLGNAFTLELRNAWLEVYNQISETMKRAAARVPAMTGIKSVHNGAGE